jgi:preprotein translocase subunit SecA
MIHDELGRLVDRFTPAEPDLPWDVEAMGQAIGAIVAPPPDFGPDYLADDVTTIKGNLEAWAEEQYEAKEADLGAEVMRQLERLVMLHVIDRLWTEYLTEMEDLRQGIGLVAYGQRDPLVQYKAEAYNLFEALKTNIEHDIVHTIFKVTLVQQAPPPLAQAVQTNRPPDGDSVNGGQRAAIASRPTAGRPVAGRATATAPSRARARAAAKVGRNDPCPCGSGKKYKHCHGA